MTAIHLLNVAFTLLGLWGMWHYWKPNSFFPFICAAFVFSVNAAAVILWWPL